MKLSELKSIIKECIEEIEMMNEGGGTRARKRTRRSTKGYKWDSMGYDQLDPKEPFDINYRRSHKDKFPVKSNNGGTLFIAKRMGGPKNTKDTIAKNLYVAANRAEKYDKDQINGIKNTGRLNRKIPG